MCTIYCLPAHVSGEGVLSRPAEQPLGLAGAHIESGIAEGKRALWQLEFLRVISNSCGLLAHCLARQVLVAGS